MSQQNKTNTPHVLPLQVYLGTAAALFVLTVVTVMVSFVDLGGWNIVVALAVASVKAAAVGLIFMHLWFDRKVFLVIFLAGIVFLTIFIGLTMLDTMRRGDIYQISADPIHKNAAMYDTTAVTTDTIPAAADSTHSAANEK
ncbi:MAG: cytochrome C oxidase subunit IV family protein [candidate division Zixibacteria bacterium]|nr:cytochrome C oxidase subunit IV family protein [candidate division Zixibacteria bacterium]